MDAGGTILHLNHKGETILKEKNEDVEGKTCSTIFGKKCMESTMGCFLMRKNETSTGHFNITTKDGRDITIEKTANAIRNDDGTIIGGLEIFQEVKDIRSDFENLKHEYYSSKEDQRKLRNLLDVGLLITSSLSVHRVLLRMINTLKEDLRYEIVIIHLPNKNNELEIWARTGVMKNEDREKPLKPGEGLVGKCYQVKKPILANNVKKHSSYIEIDDTIQAELVVPIIYQDKAIGVINAQSRELDSFSEDDIKTLSAVGNFAAIAINNATLTHELAEAKDRYKSLFNESSDPIFITDETNTSFLDCNVSATKVYKYSKEEFSNISPAMLLKLDQEKNVNPQVAFSGSWEGIHLRKDKSEIYVESKSTLIEYKAGKGYLTIVRDITERKLLEEKLKTLSETDELTKLFNRRYFIQQLEKEIDRTTRYDHPLALMMIDVDFFKEYNDKLGHQAGDDLLEKIGTLLKSMLRSSDVPCRYGGDEFSIILPHIGYGEAKQLAQRIQEEYAALKLADTNLSIGIAIYSKGLDSEQFLSRADKALYHVKQQLGRGNIAIFEVDLNE